MSGNRAGTMSGGAPSSSPRDMVDITRGNFEEVLPEVENALSSCTFFALDCEMTGLFVDGCREEMIDDIQDRYAKLRESSHNYVVNQFGLSCFRLLEGDKKHYEASTFNFYLFPEPLKGDNQNQSRKFLSDAGSLSFLASQHFDFNKWIYEGIPFMPARERQRKISEALEYYSPDKKKRSAVVPNRPDDIEFVTNLSERVRAWIAGSEPVLQIEEMNSYRRLLAFQELDDIYRDLQEEGEEKEEEDEEGEGGAITSLFFVKKVDTSNGYAKLELIRGSLDEVRAMQDEDVRKRVRAINAAAGFTRVVEAIRTSGKPAVGHNCSFDISYVLAACVEPKLPPTWVEYKKLVAEWFRGGIYDTKHLSRNLPEVFNGWTGLGDCFKTLTGVNEEGLSRAKALLLSAAGPKPERGDGDQGIEEDEEEEGGKETAISLPRVSHAPGFAKYEAVEAGGLAHEAGYDAFMTGAVFAKLVPLVAAKAALKEKEAGTNPKTPSDLAPEVPAAGGAAGDGEGSEVDMMAGIVKQEEEGGAEAAAAPLTPLYDPLAPVRPHMGRLNLMRTDMAYAALFGPDPPLVRPNLFYVSTRPDPDRAGTSSGAAAAGAYDISAAGPPPSPLSPPPPLRSEEVLRVFQEADLTGAGQPKMTFVPAVGGGGGGGGGWLVEVDPSVTKEVMPRLAGETRPAAAGGDWGAPTPPGDLVGASPSVPPLLRVGGGSTGPVIRVVPWSRYATEKAAALLAGSQAQQQQARRGYDNNKRPRLDGAVMGGGEAAPAVAATLAGKAGAGPDGDKHKKGGCRLM